MYKHIATIAGSCNATAKAATDALRKQIEAANAVDIKNTGTYRDAIQRLDDRVGQLEADVKWLVAVVEALPKK